jgi:opacity protein-like surface antigen
MNSHLVEGIIFASRASPIYTPLASTLLPVLTSKFQTLLCATLAGGFLAITPSLPGGEIDLKSIESIKQEQGAKRKYGPYVGVFAGQGTGQTGDVNIGGVGFRLDDYDGASTFGIEVGKTWRGKKWPLSSSAEFEATFMSTELEGGKTAEELNAVDPITGLAPAGTSLASYHTDMNAVFFMVNGTLSLDLYRYRARIGRFLAGMRPYIGGGIGGGQLWFRDTVTQSKDQFLGVNTLTAADQNPFSVDEFVSAWQWFGGIEYCWKDRYSLFAEYREFHLGELEDMQDYTSKGYTIGFRYRY